MTFTRGYVITCGHAKRAGIVRVYVEAVAPLAVDLAIAQAREQLGGKWVAHGCQTLRGGELGPYFTVPS